MKPNKAKALAHKIAGGSVALLLALAVPIQAYLAAGLAMGAWQAPGAMPPVQQGIEIYVEDNGIHTGIVLPKRLLPSELITRFAADDLGDPRYGANGWLAIGWGDRAFYIGTPTWDELKLSTVAAAAIGSDRTVLHVEHIDEPRGGPHVRRVVLRPEQFDQLVAFVDASLGTGRPVHGYGGWDAFYPATGRYSAIRTCNAWTGEALRAAGVPMGRWTPFTTTVMWWL